ncbi:MAG: class I SAM-dependent methyltransferase [Promethearchaeota archaeon]
MPNFEIFDAHASEYDAWFSRHQGEYKAELGAVRQLLPTSEFRGIEVGVGSGKFAAPLGIGLGVEPSKEMAARAAELGIQVIHGVAENLPFPDASFDLVLMVTTICFVDDAPAAFAEVHRVLDSRGVVVVGFIDRDSELGWRYLAKKDESKFYGPANFFSTREVVEILEGAGFREFEFRQTLFPGHKRLKIESGTGRGSFVAVRGEREFPV